MAGQVNLQATQDQVNSSSTVADANNTIKVLDAAKGELVGGGKDALKQLFEYDKSLSERYSSPNSQMYMENPMDREKAINGYFGAGKDEVTSLFDMSERVETLKKQLQDGIDKLTKQQTSGSEDGVFSLDDAFSFLDKVDAEVPEPPMSLRPGSSAFYRINADGTFEWKASKAGTPVEGFTEYTPETKVNREEIMKKYFGLDNDALAFLAAIGRKDKKYANKLFNQAITDKFKNITGDANVDADEKIKQYENQYATREEAIKAIEDDKSDLVSKGYDFERIRGTVETYYVDKESKGKKGFTPLFGGNTPTPAQ